MDYLRASFFFLTFAFVLTLLSCTDRGKEDAKSMLEKAKILIKQEEIDSAIVLCNKALNTDTSLIEAEFWKGWCLANLEKNEEAILSFEKCVAKKFVRAIAYDLIARSYFNLAYNQESVSGNDSLANSFYQKSVNYADSALRLNDRLYYAHTFKVMSFHNMNKFIEALEAVSKSIILFPDSLDLFVQKAIEKSSLNDHKTAIDEFTKLEKMISDIDSFHASKLYLYRGISLSELNDDSKAVEDFTRALEYNSDDWMIYSNRAISYYYLGRRDLCCEDLRKSADLGYVNAYDLIEKFCSK